MIKIFKPKQFKNTILLIVGFILFPTFVSGAVLYLEPAQGEYQPGDTFVVNLRMDTEGECTNAIEANLSFSQILAATDFSRGQSIITLWIRAPEINQELGLISFSGGIPGGYCGRIPGDPEASNSLGKIIFRIPGMIVGELKENIAEVKFLDTSQVLLNDGLGTKAELTTQGATFKIVPARTEPLEEDWYEEIKKDDILPEPFEIEIHQEETIFEGKYFITFQTQDKQSGIDYYETKEGNKNWKRAESPYLLEDQSLRTIIIIKAVDKAGNERTAEKEPLTKPIPWLIIISILILVLMGSGYLLYKKRKS